MNWDDIRIFASVAKEGSFSQAAKLCGTTQATISRRVQNLEDSLDQKLFNRRQSGCTLTEAGERLKISALEMKSWSTTFEKEIQDIKGSQQRVTITCGPMLGLYLTTHLEALTNNSDNINIEIKATTDILSIEKGDADIGLRNTRPTTGDLKIRRLDIGHFSSYAIFGGIRYFPTSDVINQEDLNSFWWASYVEQPSFLSSVNWLNENIDEKKIRYRLSSSFLIIETIQNNKSLAILPRFMGLLTKGITELLPLDNLRYELWLVIRNERQDKLVRQIAERVVKLLTNASPR